MKKSLCLVLLFMLSISGYGQKKKEDKFARIDAFASNTGYYPWKELAQKLTAPYTDETSKVRSVFVWVATHISYDVAAYRNPSKRDYAETRKEVDSLHVSENDYWHYVWGLEALQNKKAVCSGYSGLFKLLCDEAGLTSVVVNGAARNFSDIGKTTKRNHAWNAVKIGEDWQLLDVTWGSGTVSNSDVYEQKFNGNYFFMAPQKMIMNHYPDISFWTLLPNPVSKIWFDGNAYIHAGAESGLVPNRYVPSRAILMARKNDTLSFELEVTGQVYDILVKSKDYSESYYADKTNQLRGVTVDNQNVKAVTHHGKRRHNARLSEVSRSNKGTRVQNSLAASETLQPYALEVNDPVGNHGRFLDNGKTLTFRYIVRQRGIYNLSIFLNSAFVLGYQVIAH